VTALAIVTLQKFRTSPSAKGEKSLQPMAGLHLMVVFFGLVAVAIWENGAFFDLFGATARLGG
jgi:hypothetical protein